MTRRLAPETRALRLVERWAAEPLDMDGAARALGISRRTLVYALKAHPHYELRGRKKVFYPEHIASLRKDMHQCASGSSGAAGGPTFTEPPRMGSASDALSRLKTLAKQKKPARS